MPLEVLPWLSVGGDYNSAATYPCRYKSGCFCCNRGLTQEINILAKKKVTSNKVLGLFIVAFLKLCETSSTFNNIPFNWYSQKEQVISICSTLDFRIHSRSPLSEIPSPSVSYCLRTIECNICNDFQFTVTGTVDRTRNYVFITLELPRTKLNNGRNKSTSLERASEHNAMQSAATSCLPCDYCHFTAIYPWTVTANKQSLENGPWSIRGSVHRVVVSQFPSAHSFGLSSFHTLPR